MTEECQLPHRHGQLETRLAQVLVYSNILEQVTVFQPGLSHDMRELATLQLPRFDSHDLVATWKPIDTLLAPWLALHNTSRLELLFSCLPHLRPVVAIHAAITGNVPLLQHLHSPLNVLQFVPHFLIDYAAWSGHLDALAYLVSIRHRGLSSHAISQAARHGFFPIVRFLQRNNPRDTTAALVAAASNGHLDLVEFLYGNHQAAFDDEAMDAAAAGGHVAVVQWFYAQGSRSWRALSAAAKHGHAHVMEFLLSTPNKNWGPVSMDVAASMNYLDVLRCLKAHPHVASQHRAIDAAAANGHFEAVRLLHGIKLAKASEKAMNVAAAKGWLNIVAFLHEHKIGGCTLAAMDDGAAHGHLDVVKFLHKHRKEGCSTDAMDLAATRGHLNVVTFLHTHRHEGCTTDAMDGAASRGHLDVVRFLHEHRREGCTAAAVDRASLNNFPNVVEFLVTSGRGKVTSSCAIDAAAAHGNGHLVDFLLARGHRPSVDALESCAWRHDVAMFEKVFSLVESNQARADSALDIVVHAASRGCLGLLQSSMRLGGATTPPDAALVAAAKNGHLEVVKYLAPRCRLKPLAALDEASTHGHFEVVKYLHNEGFPSTIRAMDGAASNGHLDLLKWLNDHRTEGWTAEAFNGACRNGHLNVVKWLYVQRRVDMSPDVLAWAVEAGRPKLVEWLIMTGRPNFNLMNAMVRAAMDGNLPVFARLIEVYSQWFRGFALDPLVMVAADGGHLDMVKWIVSTAHELPIVMAMKAAHGAKRDIVMSFLFTLHATENIGGQVDYSDDDDDDDVDDDEDDDDGNSDASDTRALMEQAIDLAEDSPSEGSDESEYEDE